MSTLTKDQVLDAIAAMSVMDVVELIEMMEKKFNVTAAAPTMMAAAPVAAEAAEEKAAAEGRAGAGVRGPAPRRADGAGEWPDRGQLG